MYQPYPRMLFKTADVNRIVADEAEETRAREEGWGDFPQEGSPAPAQPAPNPEPARRGRKPKGDA